MKRFFTSIFRVFTPLRIGIVIAAAVFIWLLIFGDQGIYQLNKLTLMKKRLLYQRETLTKDIERLTNEKALLQDPKNLEPVIRKELGYIKPGEVIYQEKESK
jgi:cell division protein FtsB